MWAHSPWVGRFLSPGNRGRELEEYARWCNAVEGNTTFYAVPSERTIARWAEQAPLAFRFAFKVPRYITHELRLRGEDAIGALSEFLDAIEPLGERIGPVQLQLPPSFGPESAPALRSFVAQLPAGPRAPPTASCVTSEWDAWCSTPDRYTPSRRRPTRRSRSVGANQSCRC
jgi:uncharacterized protein YecE (DUF72 family)